eukprot:1596104-Prymnesium_polylepis.1
MTEVEQPMSNRQRVRVRGGRDLGPARAPAQQRLGPAPRDLMSCPACIHLKHVLSATEVCMHACRAPGMMSSVNSVGGCVRG